MRVRMSALLGVCVVALSAGWSYAQTLTWTGGGDGTTFAQAANWSPAAVPGASNDCVIPAGAGTVVLNTSPTVQSLTTGRNMTVVGYLTTTNGLTVQAGATLTMNNGYSLLFGGATPQTLGGGGTIQSDASGTRIQALTGSNLTIASTLTISTATGSVTIDANSGATVINNAAITVAASRQFQFTAAGTLTNNATIQATGNGASLRANGGGTFTNNGTLRWAGANVLGDVTMNPTGTGTGFANNGAIIVDGATATAGLAGTWINPTGTLTVQNGGTLRVGGTFTVPGMGSFTRTTGTIAFSGATISGDMTPPDGLPWIVIGDMTLDNATLPVNLSGSGYVTVRGTLTMQNNSEIAVDNGYQIFTAGAAPVVFTGAGRLTSLSGGGGLNVAAGTTATIKSGVTLVASSGSASVQVQSTGVLNNQSTMSALNAKSINLTLAGTLNNTGTIEATGTNSRVTITGSGTLNNSGTMRVNGSGSLMSCSISPLAGALGLVNTGTLRSTGANSTFTLAGTWSNTTGSIITETGALFNVGGPLTIPGMGSFMRTTGTLMFNAATISGDMTPPDGQPWTFNADVTLSNATLPVNFSGVSGYVTLKGDITLQSGAEISVSNGYEVYLSGPGTVALRGTGKVSPAASGGGLHANSSAVATVESGVTLTTVNGSMSLAVDNGSVLNFQGVATAFPGKVVTGNIAGTLNNSGILEAAGAGARLNMSIQGTLNNSGTIRVVGPGAATSDLSTSTGATTTGLINTGTVRVNGSGCRLTLSGKWSNPSGTFIAENSGLFELGGTFNTAQLGNFTRTTGQLAFNGATLSGVLTPSDAQPWSYTGTVTLDNATLPVSLIGSTGYVNVRGTLTIQNNSVIELNNGYEFTMVSPGPALVTGSGTIRAASGGGLLRVNSGVTATLASGVVYEAINGTGGLTVDTGGTFNNQSMITVGTARSMNVQVTGTLNNAGTMRILGNTATMNWSGAGTSNNSGTISALGTNDTISFSGAGPLVNTGTLSISGTASRAQFGVTNALGNYAANTLAGGSWITDAGGEINVPATVAIRTLGPATTVQMTGTGPGVGGLSTLTTNNGTLALNTRTLASAPVGGTFTNAGTIRLEQASLLSITGNYTQSPSGQSAHSVSGPTNAANGRLVATGLLNLDGTVQGTVVAPYVPGSVPHSLVAGANRSGTYATALGDASYTVIASYTSTDAFLQFVDCPLFTTQPSDQFACPLGGAIFTTSVGGRTPITYQWMRGTTALADGVQASGATVTGALTSSLNISGVTPAESGSYTLVATNSCGSRTSDPATLGVRACAYLCFADYDGSGGTPDLTDITEFFNGWLAGDECADVDCSGGTPDLTDITVFFDAWLAGSC